MQRRMIGLFIGFVLLTVGSFASAQQEITPITIGEYISGTLENPEAHTYRFSAEADVPLVIVARGDFYAELEIAELSATAIITSSTATADDVLLDYDGSLIFTPPQTGEYLLTVKSISDRDGRYTAIVYPYSPPTPTAFGETVESTQPLAFLQPQYYTFEAKQGDVLTLELLSTSDVRASVFHPLGGSDARSVFSGETEQKLLPYSGTYTLQFVAMSGEAAPYSFTLTPGAMTEFVDSATVTLPGAVGRNERNSPRVSFVFHAEADVEYQIDARLVSVVNPEIEALIFARVFIVLGGFLYNDTPLIIRDDERFYDDSSFTVPRDVALELIIENGDVTPITLEVTITRAE